MNGYGELSIFNSNSNLVKKYQGFFSNNKKDGFGMLLDNENLENQIYFGYWKRDLQHGLSMIVKKGIDNGYILNKYWLYIEGERRISFDTLDQVIEIAKLSEKELSIFRIELNKLLYIYAVSE
jgi:hypothetical protein